MAPSLPAQEKGECEITVREIVAENTGRGVDDKLNDIGRDLEKLSYSTFRLEQTHNRKLGQSVSGEFALLGDNKLLLTPEGFEEGKIRLKVKLTPKSGSQKVFETTLRIANGGTFIIAGPAHGQGVLFLAFTAKH
ncbi:MAG: hypothetical protein V1794_12760 [Candidatus Glassbacteria bacterium]